MKPLGSLLPSTWSLGRPSPLLAWIKVTYLPLFWLSPKYTLHSWCLNPGEGKALVSLSRSRCFPFSRNLEMEHPPNSLFARAHKFPSGMPSAFMSSTSLVLRLYCCFMCPQASGSIPFLSLSLTTSGTENLPFDSSTCNTSLKPAPKLKKGPNGVLEAL